MRQTQDTLIENLDRRETMEHCLLPPSPLLLPNNQHNQRMKRSHHFPYYPNWKKKENTFPYFLSTKLGTGQVWQICIQQRDPT
jgi:hypothetical protein